MPPVQVHHVPSDHFNADTVIYDHIEYCEEERLPSSVAVPLIVGLSAALWAAIWYAGRSVMGL